MPMPKTDCVMYHVVVFCLSMLLVLIDVWHPGNSLYVHCLASYMSHWLFVI